MPWGLVAVLVAGATGAAFLCFGFGIEAGWSFMIVAAALFGAVLFLAALAVMLLPKGEAITVCREVIRIAAEDLRKLRGL